MSRPIPQSLSSYRSEWRASSSNRNVSSPFSLAIPPPSQRRSIRERADTPTQYLEPPEHIIQTKRSAYLDVPQWPKEAVTVSEKPVRPRPYTLNGGSTSTVLSQYYADSTYRPKAEQKKPRFNDHMLAFAVTFSLALFIAIIIPIAAILPQKYIKPLPISVLMPFYVDPIQGSWERLYDTVVKHHDTNFSIIVNPSNGPGTTVWPPATYIDAVKKLNVYPNVRTLGYIDTAGGSISNATVLAQIATYAGWKDVSKDLALHGIYFDHTPWQDDTLGTATAYLRNVSASVRHNPGWTGPGEGVVVHNPGRVPDAALLAYRPDLVVLYEGGYDRMPSREALHAHVAAAKGDRTYSAMLVHSAPSDLSRGALRRIVENVRRDAEWLYVTDLSADVYAEYGSLLEAWLEVAW